MIIARIRGGLGNQLFQYAAGKRLSMDRHVPLKLDVTGYGNQPGVETVRKFELVHFNIDNTIAAEGEVLKMKYPLGIFSKGRRFLNQKIFKQFNIGYNPKILKAPNTYYLDGYFKNEEYFKPIEETIRKEITLKEPLGPKGQAAKEEIEKTILPVSLHIRRGDYVQDSATAAYHGALPIEYYHKAIAFLAERIGPFQLFIFSDDINWAKENLTFESPSQFPVHFVSCPEIKDHEELILMSLCKHNIIANSSFSWWAAWLNQNLNKIIIAPKRWLAKTGDDYYKEIPNTWIKL